MGKGGCRKEEEWWEPACQIRGCSCCRICVPSVVREVREARRKNGHKEEEELESPSIHPSIHIQSSGPKRGRLAKGAKQDTPMGKQAARKKD